MGNFTELGAADNVEENVSSSLHSNITGTTQGTKRGIDTSSIGQTIVDAGNSTIVTLAAGGVFTGEAIAIDEYISALAMIYSDVDSAVDGVEFQTSVDNVNWDHSHPYFYEANKGLHYEASLPGSYFRLKYTNGSTIQTVFRLSIKLSKGALQDHVHPIEKTIDGEHPAKIVRSVLTASDPSDQYHNIGTTLLPGNGQYALNTITSLASGLGDAFGRLRTAEPRTLFDSKQLYDNQPLFWDDQETSGSGTSSSHNPNTASTTISVGATTAGTRTRQTFQRFNYQPGKSLFIAMTAQMITPASGLVAQVGYFDDDNGLFFESNGTAVNVVRRTNVTGTPVDESIDSASWNIDPMDGTGASGITIDPTKVQILFIDMEWLGVGRARMGFYVGGTAYYCHEFTHANQLDKVYMSTPNLPIRYSISNDGTAAASSMQHICSTVISEGGQEHTGILRHKDSGSVAALSSGTVYALLGVRLKSGYLGANILMEAISAVATSSNDKAHWELRFNPTVASTFTYADETNSAVQIASGVKANTVTGGTEVGGGYFSDAAPVAAVVQNALRLGATIGGTLDTLVLCCRPITNNITVEASLTWRELS